MRSAEVGLGIQGSNINWTIPIVTTEGTRRGPAPSSKARLLMLTSLWQMFVWAVLRRLGYRDPTVCFRNLVPEFICLSDGEKQALQCLALKVLQSLTSSFWKTENYKQLNNLLPNKVCLKEDGIHILLTVLHFFSFCHSPPIKQEVWCKQQTKSKHQAEPLTGCFLWPMVLNLYFPGKCNFTEHLLNQRNMELSAVKWLICQGDNSGNVISISKAGSTFSIHEDFDGLCEIK